MDFLTQSFSTSRAKALPTTISCNPAFSAPSTIPPLKRTNSRTESLAPSFASTTTFTPSIASTDYTTTTNDLRERTNEAFSMLRTAWDDEGGGRGRAGEVEVPLPSTSAGDVRFFSKIVCRVVFLDDDKEKARPLSDEEWVIEGNLWMTKGDNAIILVVDRLHSPYSAPISSPHLLHKASRFRSLNPFRYSHRSSPVHSRSSTPDPLRRRTSDFSNNYNDSRDDFSDDDTNDQHDVDEERGFSGFVRKVFRSSNADESTSGSNGLKMVQTRTGEKKDGKEMKLEKTKSRETPGGQQAGRASTSNTNNLRIPLPTVHGHIVTALVIPTTSDIQALRFYPSSIATPSQPPTPRIRSATSTLNLTADDLVRFTSASSLLAFPSSTPPRIELVVRAPRQHGPASSGASSTSSAGKEKDEAVQRSVVVAFEFADQFLANEADDFRERVERRRSPYRSTTS